MREGDDNFMMFYKCFASLAFREEINTGDIPGVDIDERSLPPGWFEVSCTKTSDIKLKGHLFKAECLSPLERPGLAVEACTETKL